ncbi:hypothetical protein QWZ13_00680 [Reinekea marina]|nr:hypothetical protein [Reinekea marina]MDN3647418.1 hypothetical protein [Reinekea marina]
MFLTPLFYCFCFRVSFNRCDLVIALGVPVLKNPYISMGYGSMVVF